MPLLQSNCSPNKNSLVNFENELFPYSSDILTLEGDRNQTKDKNGFSWSASTTAINLTGSVKVSKIQMDEVKYV